MSSSAALVLPAFSNHYESAKSERPLLALCPSPRTSLGLAAAEVRAEVIAMRGLLKGRARRWITRESELEDLVQETSLRALASPVVFASRDHLRAWSCTVLRNLFITNQRRRQRAHRAESRLAAESSEAIPAREGALMSRKLRAALEALPQVFADAVRLVDLEDYSYADAAAALDVPVGTVMSRLFRGRKRLARSLAEA